jgi:fibronectin-binding autotransporter adhesin
VNALNLPPQPGDQIVILNGITITNDVPGQVASTTTINSGATLDMSNTGASSANTLGTVSGSGLLRINGINLPTGIYTDFVAASTGGTIEYYNTGGTVPATQTTYNNLKFSNSTTSLITFITATNPTTLVINGSLNIDATNTGTVTWQINGNGGAYNVQQVITIAGDVTVSNNGKITAGTGRAGASATQHSLTLSGNLTNNGVIQFFDPTQAPFTGDPRTLAVWTAALQGNAVNVTFSGANDAVVTCNGQTDFYRFILNKGTGQQAVLTVNSSGTSNFRFFGPSDLDADVSAGAQTQLYTAQNALSIVNGTLQLTGSIDIPVLQVNDNASGNGYTPIPINGALWLNGANVTVQLSDNSKGGTKDGRILISGLLRVTAGTINNGFGKGIGSQNGGTYWQEGGTVNCWQFRPKATGSGIFSFIQTGGTFNVGYGFGPSGGLIDAFEKTFCRFDLNSVNSTFQMSGNAILNVAKPTENTGAAPGGGLFKVGSSTANFNVTGGTVNLYMGQETSTTSYPGYITSTASLYNVNIYEESSTAETAQLVGNDLVVLNNLTINKGGALAGALTQNTTALSAMTAGTYEYVTATSGGSGSGAKFTIVVGSATAITSVTLNAGSSGYVVGDVFTFAGALFGGAGSATFSITAANVVGAPVFVTNNLDVTVGGNFSIQNGAIFTPGTGTITFNGSGAQTWAYGDSPSATSPSITSLNTSTVVVNKSAGTLSLSFPNTTVTTLPSTGVLPTIGTLTLTSGIFNDGGSVVTVSGTLTNNATHTSIGSGDNITFSGTNAIGGSNGTFGNLVISAPNSVSTSGIQTVTGDLRLTNASSTLNIGSNALTVLGGIYDAASPAITVAFTNAKRILTSGLHNAGGLTRRGINGPGVAGDILFPVGSAAVGANPAVPYTPITINVTASTQGNITARPVNSEHPNVTTTGVSLRYYWRVTSSGYSGITAASHKTYNFSTAVQSTVTGALTGPLTPNTSGLSGMTAGTYTNVSATGGAGTGARFTVVVGSATTITSVTVTSGGSGYVAGNVLTFAGNLFGIGGAGTSTFNVTAGNIITASTTNYVAARYDRALNNWSRHNTPQTMTGTTIQPNPFNTGTGWTLGAGVVGDQLDGEYTCGIGNAFGTFTTFYSRASGNWNVNSTWSIVGVGGIAATSNPTSCPTCPVVIGDGTVGNGHTITCVAASSCGALALSANATLDCGTFTGHNFGTNTGGVVSGTGTLRIAAVGVAVANMFPAGDFTNFLGSSGGTVEWYGATKTIPTTGPSPQFLSLSTYYNLVINPSAANTITLPASNLTIYNNLTEGDKAGFTGTALTNGTASIAITGNLAITLGAFNFSSAAATVTTLTVGGNTIISNGASLAVVAGGTNANTFSTPGGITNDGTINFGNTQTTVALTFTGTNNVIFGGSGATTLYRVTVNKGTSQTPTVTCSLSGTLTTPAVAALGWLTLTNGTFDFEYTGATTPITLSSSSYSIPATTKLKVGSGTVRITSTAGGGNDLFLNGALEVASSGTVYTNTATAIGSSNDIEYASTGVPTIIVSGGSLTVDGQIRRSTSTITGALAYNQSGGTVTVGGNAPDNTRGIFEIDYNTGSSFTMSGAASLIIQRPTNGSGTFADLYLNPSSSSVSSGSTISVGLATGAVPFKLNIAPSVGNFTLVGSSSAYTATMYSGDLIVGGNLTINTNATLATNSLNVSIAGNLAGAGTYNGSANTTTFNGTGAQSGALTGTSNFNNMTVNNSGGGTVLLSGTAPTLKNLNILQGILDVGALALNVNGNILNNSSQVASVPSTGSITFTTTTSPAHIIISSGGSFTNLKIGGATATTNNLVVVVGNMTINGYLDFVSTTATRYLFIGSNLLTFTSAANILNAGANTFIRTNGVSSDLGVSKNWGVGASSFTYAVGTRTNYTPVLIGTTTPLTVTTPGSYTVVPVDAQHPTASPIGEFLLAYYWEITKDNALAHSTTGSLIFQAPTSLIVGTGGTLIGAYLDAINLIGWTSSGTISTVTTNKLLTYNGSLNTVMPGNAGEFDYTFGTQILVTGPSTLPNPITAVYSRFADADFVSNPTMVGNPLTGGSWAIATSWTLSNTGYGAALSSVPTNRPVVILPTARINLDILGQNAFSTQLSGLVVATTAGHSVGAISGTGTLRTATSTLPAGTYTTFTSSAGGTIEYAGAISMNSRSTYNNLVISSAVIMANTDLIVNGNLTIGAGSSLTNTFGNNISLARNWVNNGTFSAGSGGTVTLNGTAAQTLGGTAATTFYGLAFNNSFGTSPQIVFGSNAIASNAITMTSGIVNLAGFTLTLGSSGTASTLSRAASTTTNWMYGGSFTRFWPTLQTPTPNSGNFYGLFPLGHSTPNSYRPVAVTAGSNITTTGSLTFRHVNATTSTNLSPVYDDGGTNIVRKNDSQFIGTTGGGLAGGANYTISVTMTDLAPGVVNNIRLAVSNGANTVTNFGSHVAATGPATNPVASRTGLSVANLTNDFRITSTDAIATPLPIKLLYFHANLHGDAVETTWATAQELNNDFFTIEKSLTPEQGFQPVLKVSGQGDSNVKQVYSAVDKAPYAGLSYYRLKQTDFDGNYTYSDLVAVNYEGSTLPSLNVYPNPVKQKQSIKVEITGLMGMTEVPLVIYNVLGQKIIEETVEVSQSGIVQKEYFFENPLSAGVFIVKTGPTLQLTQRLVVE